MINRLIDRVWYLALRVECALRGHDWTTYASPAVTIRECNRCAEQRWGS